MKDLIKLLIDSAKNYPDRIAVIDQDRRITYSNFIKLVNSISHQLIIKNSKPKVVFDLKQSIDAYALIVAVLNVGGTYCPLNPESPNERKLQIINEFDADIFVYESEENILKSTSQNTITIERLLKGKNFVPIEKSYNDEDIIYVIYTSGTTGNPKGVMICRKALNKFLEWAITTYSVKENDIWGQYSLLSFDLSIVDIFTCLCSGGTLFAMNNMPARNYRPASIIEKERITIWHSIPSAIEFMMKNERSKVYDFSSLRLMSFCGEPLRKNHMDFLFSKKNDLTVFNTYGPTEGTLFCTWQELKLDSFHNYCDFTMSIGKAIPGWNLILNSVEGYEEKEIIISGDYIGKGYLGSISDSKFRKMGIGNEITNTFETGDLVKEKDGNLYFSSRKDRQVKIKGFRVELDEIDFRINELLNKTSVTVVKNDSLYSFIESKVRINEIKLREFLKRKMESFKIPNAFYIIEELPRSQNQKIDFKALNSLIP